MIGIDILVQETAGLARRREWVRTGVPCPRGAVQKGQSLVLSDPEGQRCPVQTRALTHWPDGSVKWLLVDFAADLAAGARAVYRLVPGVPTQESGFRVEITPGADTWKVTTGVAEFHVDARKLRPLAQARVGGLERLAAPSRIDLLLADGSLASSRITGIVAEDQGPLRGTLALSGEFDQAGAMVARFRCRLDFFAGSSQVRLELTLHNPEPARHPGGLWDLGDPGSLLIHEFSFRLPLAGRADRLVCIPAPEAASVSCAASAVGLRLVQASSGGERSDSPVHRSAQGAVPRGGPGYRLEQGEQTLATGRRATPVLWSGLGDGGVGLCLPRCWQEFPKTLALNEAELVLALFPEQEDEPHELQGGEQKTHLWYLDVSGTPEALAWACTPLAVMPEPETLRRAQVCGDLPAAEPATDLLDLFLHGPPALVAKREASDEYGWRHFGEVPADHEGVYHQGETPFVSHYNNQYDLCAGLYRKALASGDPGWQELAADLARHVLDIDLYHTDGDREEYNRGLFWHTDHYLDAGLATHRSFSRAHLQHKDPRFCGGGPGAEHCYTGGLTLHYLLTGDPVFRQAVFDLAAWGLRSLSGPWTLLAILKRHTRTLKLLRQIPASQRPVFPRYPLTRGTGNVIGACLDAFELGGGRVYLDQAEELIRGALHPLDDPAERNLLNAEIAWSYTVLLVAVSRYLDKKEMLGEFDPSFHYARAALLNYADWMRLNEYPYLQKPEILEYPNETWAAQDLRKAVILFQAARHAPISDREPLLERARYFYQTAAEELGRHPTSSYTRPVALMLQNGWIGERLAQPLQPVAAPSHEAAAGFGRPTPRLGIGSVSQRIAGDFGKALQQTTPRREWAWLRARLN